MYKEIVNIAGVNINNVDWDETLSRIDALIHENTFSHIVTSNVDHIVNLQKDLDFKIIYNEASLVLADGMPLLVAARFLSTPLKEKVSGSDLFPKLCELAANRGYRLFFLGGRNDASEKCATILKKQFPGIYICGTYSPPFGFETDTGENEKIIKEIKRVKPDILFVGLGSPKQEKWIFKHKKEYQVPVSIGIGITFEYTSGIVIRAPQWMQKAGFEWLWRLMKEPKRLWKRYLVKDMGFFILILQQKMKIGSFKNG